MVVLEIITFLRVLETAVMHRVKGWITLTP